ncbi:MAG: dCTP deaminase [Chitinophagales bacterium]|nr:dCTP deaminase [Chitinophagales bacterium]
MEQSILGESSYLNGENIKRLLEERKLFIRPLLEMSQIGGVGIDFRLGYDFLVSVQGRYAFINTSMNNDAGGENERNIHHFFQATRRQIGETFILHPHQTVLATSLEYVKLPKDCILKLNMRSSYARLGITVSTIAQPGYCGCLSLELTNTNNNPINLTVGSRIIQGLIYKMSNTTEYFDVPRKYVCHVRPEPSAIALDKDLKYLNELWKIDNNISDS